MGWDSMNLSALWETRRLSVRLSCRSALSLGFDVEVMSQSVRAGYISDELDVSLSPDSSLMGRRIPALSGCLSTSLSPARENTSDLTASLCLVFHSA